MAGIVKKKFATSAEGEVAAEVVKKKFAIPAEEGGSGGISEEKVHNFGEWWSGGGNYETVD